MNTVVKDNVSSWTRGINHIFYCYEEKLDGLFIMFIRLKFDDNNSNQELLQFWLDFVEAHKDQDIYFSTTDMAYVKNHIKYHCNFGNKKVYKYVR